jgi:hypothetical protein
VLFAYGINENASVWLQMHLTLVLPIFLWYSLLTLHRKNALILRVTPTWQQRERVFQQR